MNIVERCVFDVVRHAKPISTEDIIDQVVLFLPDQQRYDVKRTIEKLVDLGKIEYEVDFRLTKGKR